MNKGVRIGKEGFGYVKGEEGIDKVKKIGRVIIKEKVEIGENKKVDSG